jgi:hypothetical protein
MQVSFRRIVASFVERIMPRTIFNVRKISICCAVAFALTAAQALAFVQSTSHLQRCVSPSLLLASGSGLAKQPLHQKALSHPLHILL